MPVDPHRLHALAGEYIEGMTSIRGRRVQRLIAREFAGADTVRIVRLRDGRAAVVGVAPSGAALCATDGRGRQATVVKWRHGSSESLETAFDLLKDSLPVIGRAWVPLDELFRQALSGLPTVPLTS